MNKHIIKVVILLGFSILLFFGCKPKPTTENAAPNRTNLSYVNEKADVSDTLAFVESVKSRSAEYDLYRYDCPEHGRYVLASCDSLRYDDLDYIPPRELRIIRNEIYARYGYRFKD